MFKSKWICDGAFEKAEPIDVFHKEYFRKDFPESAIKNHHVWFLKEFSYEGGKVSINITADDYYKLYIGGAFVGQGPAPSYVHKFNYNTYDITPFLKKGVNFIMVHTYYQGLINRVWNSGDMRFGMIADVTIDGEFLFGTDESWLCCKAEEYTDGGKVGYDTAYLENIDGRAKKVDFRNVPDKSLFGPVCIKANDDHVFAEKAVKSLHVQIKKPVEITEKAPGHFFVDFGEEFSGVMRFKAKGGEGDIITLMCGEELSEEKTVRHDMRCGCNYLETLTLSGKEDIFDFYDYKAFRYGEIVAKPGVIFPDSIEAVEQFYPYDKTACTFKSENELLEKIWNLCAHTVEVGSQEVYVDCPTREKGQYLGDFLMTGLSHLYLTGDTSLYEKALDDFAASTFICPGMMATAPGSHMQEIVDFSLLYPEEVYNLYKYTGDKGVIEKYMPVMEGIIEYMRRYDRGDGLLAGVMDKWNLVDWPANLRDDYDFTLTAPPTSMGCHNVINAYYIGALETINKMKQVVGRRNLYNTEDAKRAYIAEFYDENQKLFVDCKASAHTAIHSNALPLYFGIAPREAEKNIVSLIKKKGLCCGVWFSYFVIRALGRAGDVQGELDMILNETEHSWANMIREGATTCFEAWGKEQKWNTSLCHPWASAPIVLIIEDILGFSADGKKATFCPKSVSENMELTLTYKGKKVKISTI